MTTTAYGKVEEAFERVYQQLREDNGENAPNSNVYYAPTLAGLLEEAPGHEEEIRAGEAEAEVLGDPDSPTVAWAIELNNYKVYRITEWVSEGTLLDFFGRCMGYDL